MTRRPRIGADRGAAAVEMALVLPILLLLVFGIIDFGRMLNAQIRLTEAAREAARAHVLGADPQSRFDKVVVGMSGAKLLPPVTCPVTAASTDDAKFTGQYEFEFITPVAVLAGLLPNGSANGKIVMQGTGVMPCRA